MDYRDFKEKNPAEPKAAPRLTNKRWWEESSPKEAAAAAWKQQRALEEQQSYREDMLVRHARLFGGNNLVGLGLGQYARPSGPDAHTKSTAANVIRSCIESVVAMTCAARPRPSYLTDGGKFSQREKAKLLNKFTRGQFYESRYYEMAPDVATDAATFGTGVIKSMEKDGRVCLERVFVGHLFVDEAEAAWGAPRQLYQTMPIARDVLRGMFPDASPDAIEDAEQEETDGETFAGDMVRVVEAWHLPSSKGAKDGKHLICTSAGILGEVDEWTRNCFPFAFLRWAKPRIGFWGTGVAEQLTGKQLEINKLAKRMQQMLHFSVPWILVPEGSKIPPGHITNEIGNVIRFAGMAPPAVVAPSMIPAEYFKRQEDLKREAFEEVGVSQMMASGIKPAGLNSGRAQREHADIQSSRFVLFGQAYEQLALDVARNQIDLTRDIATRVDPETKKPAGYSVKMPDKKLVERIDWSEIGLEEDEYIMQAFPVSSLPTTPAARQETIAEWVANGWVSPEEGRMLLDFPDLEHSTNLAVAAIQDIDRTIDHILSGKGYLPPEPLQNLQLGVQRCMSAYLQGRTEGYPAERLELLQNWILQAQAMLTPPAPPAPPAPAAMAPEMAAMPPGPPMPGPELPPPAPPLAA